MSAAFHRNAADGACQKGIFATLSNETHFVGLSFEKAAARRSALAYARTFASRKSIFADVHAAGKNVFHFICACGRKLCEAFSTG